MHESIWKSQYQLTLLFEVAVIICYALLCLGAVASDAIY